MATSWPQGVDAFPTWTNGVDLINASIVNNVQDSVGAVQAEIERTYRPDLKPASPSAYDDEFETGVLDVKWTPVNCALGTVDLLTTAAAADTYDPTIYRGMMALQPGRDDAMAAGMEAEAAILRQTVALAGTCKVAAKMHVQATAPGVGNTAINSGILLSGANGFNDNDYIFVSVAPTWNPGGPIEGVFGIGMARSGGGAPTLLAQQAMAGGKYCLITKTGTTYSAFVGDGHSWAAMTDLAGPDNTAFTVAGGLVRLSMFSYWGPPAAEVNLPNPIGVFDFVRYFANNTPVVNA